MREVFSPFRISFLNGKTSMTSEREQALAQVNYWDELLALRDQQRENRKSAIQVVKGSQLPQELNKQGLMRWYLHPSITDTELSTLLFYEQEIPPGSRSGKIKFQGEQVIYILEGKGYTLVDGVKQQWEAGDVLNLPVRKRGIIVQHVNEDAANPAKLVAVEPNFFACTSVDRGSGFEQIEEAPEYRR
jgi:quercetin dioxygenase-like cupin family protein